MGVRQNIDEITRRITLDEATDKEVDVLVLQILSSMYNESQRDREALTRHYEEQKILLTEIKKAIEHKEKQITENTRRIGKLEGTTLYHSWVLGIVGFFTTVIGSWAVPRILEYVFS